MDPTWSQFPQLPGDPREQLPRRARSCKERSAGPGTRARAGAARPGRGALRPRRAAWGAGRGGDARSGPGWAGSAGRGAVELSLPPSPELPARRRQDGALGTGSSGGPRGCHTRAHAAGPGTRLDPRHPPGPRPGVARGAPPAGAVPVTRGRAHRWRDAGCSGGAGLDLPGSAGPPGGKSLRGAAASGCCPEGTAALNRHRRGL